MAAPVTKGNFVLVLVLRENPVVKIDGRKNAAKTMLYPHAEKMKAAEVGPQHHM